MHRLATPSTAPTAPRHAVLAFDEDGFLMEPALWSQDLARTLAEEEGLDTLTEAHWRVIGFIREKFLRLGSLVNLRQVCRGTDLNRDQVKALFGGCRAIWRIAGLPNPGEEAKSYLN